MSHPILNYAFRPFYLLAALYGALSILLWSFDFQGIPELPGFLWHAHEMIWGYSGAIVVAFLLTAVATWTNQAPVSGIKLLILILFWSLARIFVFIPTMSLYSAIFGSLFYLFGTFFMAQSVFNAKNSRNYIAVIGLLLFGLSHIIFHYYLLYSPELLRNGLIAGLMIIAGFIGLIGGRIIPFFTSKRLNIPQIQSPMPLLLLPLLLPILIAINLMINGSFLISAVLALITGVINSIQCVRWFNIKVLKESMLWILFLGYLLTALGLLSFSYAQYHQEYISLSIHLISVGGIGVLTVGMMARTALGHTGRPIYPAPRFVTLAFVLMIAATIVRTAAALLVTVNITAYSHSIKLSGTLFALSLLIYFFRYAGWLTSPRADGKPG